MPERPADGQFLNTDAVLTDVPAQVSLTVTFLENFL